MIGLGQPRQCWLLGLAAKPGPQISWMLSVTEACVSCRGVSHSLRPQQILFVLPGSGYKESDLQTVEQEALRSMSPDLLQDAWEVSLGSARPVRTSFVARCQSQGGQTKQKLDGFAVRSSVAHGE